MRRRARRFLRLRFALTVSLALPFAALAQAEAPALDDAGPGAVEVNDPMALDGGSGGDAPVEVSDAGPATATPEAGDAGQPLVADEAAPDAGPPARETTVSARLADVRRVAGSAQVIGKEDLERQETNDLHRVLQGVAGVYVREEDGFGLRPNIGLRGASADRSSKVTLLEDGVLFGPAPYSAPAAYYVPLVTRLVGVEVFKGPAAIRYGPQSIGGARGHVRRPVRAEPGDHAPGGAGDDGAVRQHSFRLFRWFRHHLSPAPGVESCCLQVLSRRHEWRIPRYQPSPGKIRHDPHQWPDCHADA